jgi:hypothetical protein
VLHHLVLHIHLTGVGEEDGIRLPTIHTSITTVQEITTRHHMMGLMGHHRDHIVEGIMAGTTVELRSVVVAVIVGWATSHLNGVGDPDMVNQDPRTSTMISTGHQTTTLTSRQGRQDLKKLEITSLQRCRT